jgi:adenylyltransferase/sulfurtransferase
MKAIDVYALKEMRDQQTPHLLIDVREIHEVELCSIGGKHIPMGEIIDRHSEIPTDVPVVIHCRSGQRSSAVITALENHFGFENLHNLTGGILAWAREIDSSVEPY